MFWYADASGFPRPALAPRPGRTAGLTGVLLAIALTACGSAATLHGVEQPNAAGADTPKGGAGGSIQGAGGDSGAAGQAAGGTAGVGGAGVGSGGTRRWRGDGVVLALR